MSLTRTRIADVADRLFGAIERGDLDALTAMWSDDVVVAPGRRPGAGQTRARSVIVWFVDATTDRPLRSAGPRVLRHRIRPAAHPARHQPGRRKGGAAGGHGGQLDDGRIRRIDEYLDPAELAPLL